MKTTIETIEFPCEIKKKLKMKVSMSNLEINYIDGHLIKFDKTNLSVQEPHKIIVSNKNHTLIALLYNGEDKIYLPTENVIISITKYISILNTMNKIY